MFILMRITLIKCFLWIDIIIDKCRLAQFIVWQIKLHADVTYCKNRPAFLGVFCGTAAAIQYAALLVQVEQLQYQNINPPKGRSGRGPEKLCSAGLFDISESKATGSLMSHTWYTRSDKCVSRGKDEAERKMVWSVLSFVYIVDVHVWGVTGLTGSVLFQFTAIQQY